MRLKAGDVLEVYLPSNRLFVIDKFPEPTAREHLEAHVGRDRFGQNNMEKPQLYNWPTARSCG